MDHRTFKVRTWSLLGTPTTSHHHLFDSEKLNYFLVLLTGFEPSPFGCPVAATEPTSHPSAGTERVNSDSPDSHASLVLHTNKTDNPRDRVGETKDPLTRKGKRVNERNPQFFKTALSLKIAEVFALGSTLLGKGQFTHAIGHF